MTILEIDRRVEDHLDEAPRSFSKKYPVTNSPPTKAYLSFVAPFLEAGALVQANRGLLRGADIKIEHAEASVPRPLLHGLEHRLSQAVSPRPRREEERRDVRSE